MLQARLRLWWWSSSSSFSHRHHRWFLFRCECEKAQNGRISRMFTSYGVKNGRRKTVARARWSIGMREKPRSVTCAEIRKWSFLMHCRCVAAWTDPANLERSILGQQMTVYSLEVAQKCVPRPRLTCFRWNICHTRRRYIACRLHPETRSRLDYDSHSYAPSGKRVLLPLFYFGQWFDLLVEIAHDFLVLLLQDVRGFLRFQVHILEQLAQFVQFGVPFAVDFQLQ